MCICVYIIVLFVHLGGTILHLLRNHVHNALLNLLATGAVHAPSTSPMCSWGGDRWQEPVKSWSMDSQFKTFFQEEIYDQQWDFLGNWLCRESQVELLGFCSIGQGLRNRLNGYRRVLHCIVPISQGSNRLKNWFPRITAWQTPNGQKYDRINITHQFAAQNCCYVFSVHAVLWLFPLKNSHESICIYLQCYTHRYIYIYIHWWVRIDISQLYTTISWMVFHSKKAQFVWSESCCRPTGALLSTAGDERGLFTDCGECESLPRWQRPCIPGAGLWSLVVVLWCLLVDGFSKLDRNGKCRIMFETDLFLVPIFSMFSICLQSWARFLVVFTLW